MDLCICNTKWTLGVGIQESNGASETLLKTWRMVCERLATPDLRGYRPAAERD